MMKRARLAARRTRAELAAMKGEVLPEALEAFVGGASLVDLERRWGISRQTFYRWMLGAVGDAEHKDLVTACLAARVAGADGEMDDARDMLAVQKAREKMRFTRFDLERRRPEIYGPKQEVRVAVAPVLHIHAPMPEGRVVDGGTPVPSALSDPPGEG